MRYKTISAAAKYRRARHRRSGPPGLRPEWEAVTHEENSKPDIHRRQWDGGNSAGTEDSRNGAGRQDDPNDEITGMPVSVANIASETAIDPVRKRAGRGSAARGALSRPAAVIHEIMKSPPAAMRSD
jgi:hypothetical protein